MSPRHRPELDLVYVIRELAKITDRPFREIGEALTNDMLENAATLSEHDYTLGMDIGGALETLFPAEGIFERGPDAERALDLIKRVL